MDRSEIIEKWEKALSKAKAVEKLRCQVSQIQNTIKELKSGCEIKSTHIVFPDYILGA
jgi:hypothetical protein